LIPHWNVASLAFSEFEEARKRLTGIRDNWLKILRAYRWGVRSEIFATY
jgi:hypothetical protein